MRRAKELGITLGNAAATHNGRMTPKHIEQGLLGLLLASMLASTACEAQPQSNVGQSVTKLLKNQP